MLHTLERATIISITTGVDCGHARKVCSHYKQHSRQNRLMTSHMPALESDDHTNGDDDQDRVTRFCVGGSDDLLLKMTIRGGGITQGFQHETHLKRGETCPHTYTFNWKPWANLAAVLRRLLWQPPSARRGGEQRESREELPRLNIFSSVQVHLHPGFMKTSLREADCPTRRPNSALKVVWSPATRSARHRISPRLATRHQARRSSKGSAPTRACVTQMLLCGTTNTGILHNRKSFRCAPNLVAPRSRRPLCMYGQTQPLARDTFEGNVFNSKHQGVPNNERRKSSG